MPNFESIVIVEDWISEHYFTSEGKGTTFQKHVLDLRKEWEAEAKEGHDTVLKRFSATRLELQTQMAALAEAEDNDTALAASGIYQTLREVLGFVGKPEALKFERGAQDHTIPGLWLGDTKDALWLDGTPATGDDALTEASLLGAGTAQYSEIVSLPVAKVISELYQCDPSPKYIIVAVGSYLFLTERERWPEGRYLTADVQLIADRNDSKKGGETDRLLSIFSKQSIAANADGTIWWDARLEESRQHAVGVSKDLRDGIRESIEIIANDVLQRRTADGLSNDEVDGQDLARQSLRFLYRILFLLYAEASPELGVLPKGAGEYDTGYGLDRLRELVQVELASHQSQVGTHLFESLNLLFELVNGNHDSQKAKPVNGVEQNVETDDALEENEGLIFEALEADLFAPASTSLINASKLGNAELQRVLERLLLSKAGAKGDRGFISYANLGINQLGAVYEGLMSYTGFIAEEDLREVAKNGDATKGSWVVPVERAEAIDSKHFVKKLDEDGIPTAVLHPKGSFVYRLAGRERQQSASYYTPEVLTKFVVSQALEELLTDEISADKILELDVCEPALGSGAFAIEAVRQLADEYLKRKQAELGRDIPADEYPKELQRVKAHIALHQVHGVDLNATAVELAEVSLWLDTMQPGLSAPWFGLRLKQGNSLVGARRATYSVEQIKRKKYLSEEPQANPLTGLAEALATDSVDPTVFGKVHHFLLPGDGWGAAADAKEVKDLAGVEQKKLKDWAKSTRIMLNKTQIARLQAVSERVEVLWQVSLRRMKIASSEARRFVDYWPHEREAESTTVTRAEIEKTLSDPNGAYRRLRRAMNAWNALWFWPLTESDVAPPSIDQWIDAMESLLGKPVGMDKKAGKKAGLSADQTSILSNADWADLRVFEDIDFPIAQMGSKATIDEAHPWLVICDRVSDEQGFFHWELEFANVFAKGGFDLQVGNPPWVRPDWDEKSVYAEYDSWWQLEDNATQKNKTDRKILAHEDSAQVLFMIQTGSMVTSLRRFLTSGSNYPIVSDLRPDLYRSFIERSWRSASPTGIVSLIHPESHFTELKARNLRAAVYRRLRRHWQFTNSLELFEIHPNKVYGVNIYASSRDEIQFLTASSIFHPDTVVNSLAHEGGTEAPGLKTDSGEWDLRPHPERIVKVDEGVLGVWARCLDAPGTAPVHARMLYPVNLTSMVVIEKMSQVPRARSIGLQYSTGWNETTDKKNGYFEVGSSINTSWDNVIIQGPHFSVANPFSKQPNLSMKNNTDWTEIDLEDLPSNFVPRTSFQPLQLDSGRYDAGYTHWEIGEKKFSAREFDRIVWRKRVPNDSVRSFYSTVIPAGTGHVNQVVSAYSQSFSNPVVMMSTAGHFASMVLDFWVRIAGYGDMYGSVVDDLPLNLSTNLNRPIAIRMAKLSCLTSQYSSIFNGIFEREWSPNGVVRNAYDRRILEVEIDVLVGLVFTLSCDELLSIYRTQFHVMKNQDRRVYFDHNGRKIPAAIVRETKNTQTARGSAVAHHWVHPQSGVEYTLEPPFRVFDRESELRAAYAKFSKMLEEHGEIIEDGE